MRTRGSKIRLLCGLATLAAVASAVVPEPSSARTPRRGAHHAPRHHVVRPAALQPLRLRLPAPDDFSGGFDADSELAFGPPPSVVDRPPTSIDYRLAPRGPVGSLGLLRQGGAQATLPATFGPTGNLGRGYPEVTAGAKLSYPF